MINNAEILPSLKITFCKFELSKTAITIAPLNILPAFREQKMRFLLLIVVVSQSTKICGCQGNTVTSHVLEPLERKLIVTSRDEG